MAGANKRAGRYTHTQVGRRRAKEIRHGPFVPHEHPEDGCLLSLAVQTVISGVIMYLVMFVMIDGLDSFYNNLNMLYMTLMMVAPMVVLMILAMRHVRVEGRQHRADRRVAGRLLRQLCTHPHPVSPRSATTAFLALDDPASFSGRSDVPRGKAQRSGSHPALRKRSGARSGGEIDEMKAVLCAALSGWRSG